MELEYSGTIYIDINTIIDSFLDEDNQWDSVEEAVDDYVCGLDDCDYYIIDSEMTEKIVAEVMKHDAVKEKLEGCQSPLTDPGILLKNKLSKKFKKTIDTISLVCYHYIVRKNYYLKQKGSKLCTLLMN